jgi:uncharacterized membrane protein
MRKHLLWIGPLLTLSGAWSYFAWFARFPALRDFPWVNLPLVLLGLALTIAGALRSGRGSILKGAAVLVAALVTAGFFGYVFVLSPTARTASLATAPELEALAPYRGKAIVLVFYRGHW